MKEKSEGGSVSNTSPNVEPRHVWVLWPTFAITSTILSCCLLIVALASFPLPSCCHLCPAIISALSLAASAVWVLESGEYEVRAGGREETYCQGYASEDDWCQAGLSCQPVRRQECLMFSLLVTLLCIFLCQRRRAIWTAKALQRPAGHLSSPDAPNAQPQLSASDLLWLESRLTDRSSVRRGEKKESFLSLCENINVPIMGHNCQRRPAPDNCVASLICSPGDLHSSQFKFGCGVTYKQAAICCSPLQERVEETMLIEDSSSFRINHKSRVPFLLKSGHRNG